MSRGNALRSTFAPGFPSGTSRVPDTGNDALLPSDRIVMNCVAAASFAFNTKLPTKVSPARSRITSPGTASLIAVCRLVYWQELRHTVRVEASARAAIAKAHISRHTTLVIRRAPERRTDSAKSLPQLLC